ncbi:unnamed protein product [Thlaspi arvense]|uniref:Uncharacterized protein n=1 Tax=Thlaspi arvense TaxID=13288 RepID=A0AAU9SGW8_THLAR|nr:unnamed protein product [Thlaspi arvense]
MAERFSRLSDKEKKKKSADLSRFLNKKASSENNKKVSEASLESRVGMFKEEKFVEDQTNVVSTMINVGGYEDQSFWDNLYKEDAFGLNHGFFLDNNNFQANTTTDDYMIDGTFTQLPNSAPPSFEQLSIPHYNQDCGNDSYMDLLLLPAEEELRSWIDDDLLDTLLQ